MKFGGKIYAFDGYPSLDTPPDDFKQSAFEVIGGIQTNSFTLTLPNTSAVVGMFQNNNLLCYIEIKKKKEY